MSALPDVLINEAQSLEEREEPINKFLLCRVVCGVAREIKNRAEQSGEHLSLLKIVRDVLHSYQEEAIAGNGLAAALASGPQQLDEEVLSGEIDRRWQVHFSQSLENRAEARRLDIESLIAAEVAKRGRNGIKRGSGVQA